MEQQPELERDAVTERAIESINTGQAGPRPLYEAASRIAAEEEQQRLELINNHNDTDLTSSHPELFPANVFNPDGSRKTDETSKPLMTDAEQRAYFELEDSRW